MFFSFQYYLIFFSRKLLVSNGLQPVVFCLYLITQVHIDLMFRNVHLNIASLPPLRISSSCTFKLVLFNKLSYFYRVRLFETEDKIVECFGCCCSCNDTASKCVKVFVAEWLFKCEISNQILNATQGEARSCLSSCGVSNKLRH